MKACAHISTRTLNLTVGYSIWSMQKSGTGTGTGPCSIVTPFSFNLGWEFTGILEYMCINSNKDLRVRLLFFKVIRDCWLHCLCSLRPCTDLEQNSNLLKFCRQKDMVGCRHQMALIVLQVSFVSQSHLFLKCWSDTQCSRELGQF